MKSAPFCVSLVGSVPGAGIAPPNFSGAGKFPPSCQKTLSAGRVPLAAKSSRMTSFFGGLSLVAPSCEMHSAPTIEPFKSNAVKGQFRMWHPMSPNAPVPKSQNPRHLNGWQSLKYGRSAAGPSQRSQSSDSGIGSPLVGHVTPCGQMGRLLQQCASFTFPISPAWIHSLVSRKSSLALPWLPICVATPASLAAW